MKRMTMKIWKEFCQEDLPVNGDIKMYHTKWSYVSIKSWGWEKEKLLPSVVMLPLDVTCFTAAIERLVAPEARRWAAYGPLRWG